MSGTLSEGVATRVAYKMYVESGMTPGALATLATQPGPSGGQQLRYTTLAPSYRRNTYQSAEHRSDRQVVDLRHGVGHVEGNIQGELSPKTYFDFIEATHRDTRVSAALALTNTDLTSVAATAATSVITFASGDPVALGLKVGDIIRLTNTTDTTLSNANLNILSFSGTSNRIVKVDPAPKADMAADTTFNLARIGSSTKVPSTGFLDRKLLLEVWNTDSDVARIFTETRVASYRVSMPATGLSTFETTLAGRQGQTLTGAAAPYFTSPTVETTTGICASANGALWINGVSSGVITSVDFTHTLAPTYGEVVGQNFTADVALGRNVVTGSLSAYFTDSTIFDLFEAETEFALLIRLEVTSAVDTPAIVCFMPRVKLSSVEVTYQAEGLVGITANFQALKYVGAGPGIEQTTVRIIDTEA